MWCAFEEPDDYRVVRQPDGLTGPTHFVQIEVLDPELRALLRVSDGNAEMPNRAKLYFHICSYARCEQRSTDGLAKMLLFRRE
jgi:hypothetical protein